MHKFGLFALLGTGCYSSWEAKDADGDGVSGVQDCWESTSDPVPPNGAMMYDTPLKASDIFVGAEDRPYDGIDQNCDGKDDFDVDGDGYVPNIYVGISTIGLEGTGLLLGGDCDDADATKFPDTVELCDGIINGCSNDLDEIEKDHDGDGFVACTVVETGWLGDSNVLGGDDCDDGDALLFPTQVWYKDIDGDSFGDAAVSTVSCQQPNASVLDNTDCDDSDPFTYPSAAEICDGIVNACEGELGLEEIDNDGDGYVECSVHESGWNGVADVLGGDDCSDEDATVYVSLNYYLDVDQDGYGDPNNRVVDCRTPVGYVLDNTDCDDLEATTYLNAPELCDGIVNACGTTLSSDEIDNDGDHYVECEIDAGGWDGDETILGGGDCDDASITEFPGQWWFADLDGDGHGNLNAMSISCQQPSQTSLLSDDCDDTASSIYPNAPELCDGLANVCGTTLSSDEIDNDGDGHVECALDVSGWTGVTGGGDCDDTDPFTFVGAAENDSPSACQTDVDGDGYGSSSPSVGVAGIDCDDSDPFTYTGAPEICDGLVNTCGGTLPANEVDDDGDHYVECTVHSSGWNGDANVDGGEDCNDANPDENPIQEWYQDSDEDGVGGDIAMSSCLQPAGFVVSTGDCDDADEFTKPNAFEICDGADNNCDGAIPSNEMDDDGDGYVECTVHSSGWSGSASVDGGGDCDDSEPLGYPGAAGMDSTTACMIDVDLDGYGDADYFGNPFVAGTDCDDSDDTVYPTAEEVCDGQDNDCDDFIPANEIDGDLDGYVECKVGPGMAWNGILGGDDCNPNNDAIYPYAPENGDTTDNNCDGYEYLPTPVKCVSTRYTSGSVDKYFLYCKSNRTPDSASVLCRSLAPTLNTNPPATIRHDNLASINSLNEMNAVSALVTTAQTTLGVSVRDYFIGLYRPDEFTGWSWKDGSQSSYTYGAIQNPGAAGNVYIRVEYTENSANFSWNARPSTDEAYFVCSKTF